ncbi:helix-turn-helix domain-containing protein [Desulfurivibrio sp. D14AmB]|uniref:helix-turn-helix domain-containing protein n=1 Tax=Desulfurivibrio sp. D14AmB TaxID=3374370 RepID=UPI00376F34E1
MTIKPAITADELVTLDELSKVTKIPKKTWSNWIAAGKSPLRPLKIVGHVRFRGADVLGLIRGEVSIPPKRGRGRPTKAEQIARQRSEQAAAERIEKTVIGTLHP